ncbi:hypothetical protein EVAR_30665_1 [Eumeta japonica]|uniref:Uncharacterized protein n=1 Tax=Eumeta variegata TaxID=151549 RepID=A0A4C1VSA7_EUMVA|nr:hypothetical protein EVAR_30665_1 [Eumeta japonica]
MVELGDGCLNVNPVNGCCEARSRSDSKKKEKKKKYTSPTSNVEFHSRNRKKPLLFFDSRLAAFSASCALRVFWRRCPRIVTSQRRPPNVTTLYSHFCRSRLQEFCENDQKRFY